MSVKFNSIPLKVCLSILCIETILLALMGAYYIKRFDREIEQRVQEKLILPGALMSHGALNYDVVKERQVIGELVQEQIADTFIFRPDGRVFFSSEPEREGMDFRFLLNKAERELLISEGEGRLQFGFHSEDGQKYITSITPIHHGEKLLGYLYIKIQSDNIEREKRRVLLLFVFGSVLTIALTTLLEALFVYRLFVPRIEDISSTLEGVENGNLQSRVGLHGSPDELQLLGRRVNTMIGSVGRHIKEISETKDKLAKSEERFRELSDLMPETIFEVNREGRLTYLNQRGMDVFQYGPDDIRDGIYNRDLLLGGDRQRSDEILKKRLSGELTGIVEYTASCKDGSTFPVHVSSSPIVTGGKAVGLRGVVVDVTEKKRMEARLQQAQKMEAIGRLSASVAHEFGNPLIGVHWLLKDVRSLTCLDGETRKMVEVGIQECRRMRGFLQDFQRVSKETTGSVEQSDIHAVLDQCLLFYRKFLRDKGVNVVKEYDAHLPQVRVIRDQISQVFVNLVMNAIEAMAESGGELAVSTAGEGGTVNVTVCDNGHGIKKEDLDHIFEPFFSTKSEVNGMGLGLYVSYTIIQSHQGDLVVDSEYGKGASFTVTLPVDGIGTAG